MPSYRYTRDIKQEDLQTQKPAELSRKQKRKNWWHYHWRILLVCLATVVVVGFFVAEILRKDDPDLVVGVLATAEMPDVLAERVKEQLGELVGDVNSDGKVVVQLDIFTVTVGSEEEDGGQDSSEAYVDPYSQMAGVTKLSAALSDDTTMLFLVQTDELETYIDHYGIFCQLDGSPLPSGEGEVDFEAVAYQWQDSPVLSALDLTMEYDGTSFDAQEYMDFFSVAVRGIAGGKAEGKQTAQENWSLALQLANEWK